MIFIFIILTAVLGAVQRSAVYFFGVKPNLVLAFLAALFVSGIRFWEALLLIFISFLILSRGFGLTVQTGLAFFLPFSIFLLAGRLRGKKFFNLVVLVGAATAVFYLAARYFEGLPFEAGVFLKELAYNTVLAAGFYFLTNYVKKAGSLS